MLLSYTLRIGGRTAPKEVFSYVHLRLISSNHFDDPGVPKVAITKDRQTSVLYHPKKNVQYEDTLPIPRHDANYSAHESLESVIRERLDSLDCSDKALDKATFSNPWPMSNREVVPTIMKLANMFYTTKHRWFPGKTKEKRMKKDPPQDRPMN